MKDENMLPTNTSWAVTSKPTLLPCLYIREPVSRGILRAVLENVTVICLWVFSLCN